jgi:hypothetical protein
MMNHSPCISIGPIKLEHSGFTIQYMAALPCRWLRELGRAEDDAVVAEPAARVAGPLGADDVPHGAARAIRPHQVGAADGARLARNRAGEVGDDTAAVLLQHAQLGVE